MELKFKHPTIKTDYEFYIATFNECSSPKDHARVWAKNKFSKDRQIFSILIGYLRSLCEFADECEGLYDSHPTLDLTYDTVKHLPHILAHQYFVYVESGSYTSERALKIANKTLVAYFMLLCMNEHMCFPTISRLDNYEDIVRSAGSDISSIPADSWMGTTIKVGVNKEFDLLQELEPSIKVSKSGVLRIRISRLVELYKQMCGVDLREKGLDDLEFSL